MQEFPPWFWVSVGLIAILAVLSRVVERWRQHRWRREEQELRQEMEERLKTQPPLSAGHADSTFRGVFTKKRL